MNLYPAIDIKAGECVRLYQGDYNQVTSYSNDPVAVAQSFAKQGASLLHVVDLDGAKQASSVNLNLIQRISLESGLKVQTGGGIRSKQQIINLFKKGICRIVLGSIAVLNPIEVKKWLKEFGNERIVLALDIRMINNRPQLALDGWQTTSPIDLWQLLTAYQDCSLTHVLCTDINRDGTLQGPNINLYKECVAYFPSIQFQASGGICSIDDLQLLSKIPVSGAIIGKALYENKFSLSSALNEISIC